MVEVEKWGSTGRMKSFRIHDLMRDLCLFKAQEENFLQFVDLRNRDEPVESVSFGTKTNVKPRNKVRRVAIYANHHVSDLLPFIDNGEGSLRCLIFVNRGVEPRKQVFKPLFNRFRMLRVLNLDNMLTPSFSGKLPKEIGKLIHLRLLSLDNSNVESIPSSIGNLSCLQTLNLAARMKRWEVPNVMWKLQQLRHLYLPMSYHVSGKCLRLTNVSNLQTLLVVPTKYLDVNDFQQLTNLKKLGICVDKNIGRIFHNPPSVRFNCVRSLHVHNEEEDMIDIIPVILSYPQIYKLELWSPIIKLPEDYQFSPNLMKLVLGDTYLKDDPMSTIEKLPNLRVASIRRYCFKGNEMVCSKGGFPRLELLEFFAVFKLKEWKVEEGALPSLCHLRIRSCRKLSRVPDGLRYVTTLKKIEIENMPREFITRVEEGGEDLYKVQHVPSIVTFAEEDIRDTSSDTEDES
ncbi:LRR domain containing protein [Trema orientale]|uniref:LRR domain containing protein n=1 Tax=Trema orientale TaxID=63057 RepID=A0A2P5EEJ9_TREOI|nr:LRR domain containing protein [Trema orientale]